MDSENDDGRGLLAELLSAPDRDRCPGARPVVSVREDDEPGYLEEVEAREVARVPLERRGRWHGEWAMLAGEPEDPADARIPLTARLHQRWHAAKPIVLRGALDVATMRAVLAGRVALGGELGETGALRAFLERGLADLEPHFELGGPARLADPERDLERNWVRWHADPDAAHGPRMNDLWAKSAWLSTHEDDRSLRVRLSFGEEGRGDAARDLRRHRRVAELAEGLFPECALVHDDEGLAERLATWVGDDVLFTQHIAYWNAPGGGALFHHDAFDEPLVGGQRGVLFAQLVGRSAWLALSVDDLASRVAEFVGYLDEGELHWVRDALFPRPADLRAAARLCADPRRARRELVRPGCGVLGGVVDRGPEFTAFLADGGHAFLLDPGDAIVLPNHGLGRTCMHSVFCADEDTSYGISFAMREEHPAEPEPEDRGGPRGADARGSRRRGSRRRSRSSRRRGRR